MRKCMLCDMSEFSDNKFLRLVVTSISFMFSHPHRTHFLHDDVTKWKHFPRYWPFVRGIHRSPANSPHKGQWRGALMFSLICAWINGWVNNCEAGDLRHHCTHYDVMVMVYGKMHNYHSVCKNCNHYDFATSDLCWTKKVFNQTLIVWDKM